MTGELTLRGQVLSVGGIREKVSAAARAGVTKVLLPAANRKDVEVLSVELRTGVRFEFFERLNQYLDEALLPAKAERKAAAKEPKEGKDAKEAAAS